MSRLYVTSSRTRAQRAGDVCSELRPSGSYEGEGCFARSYRKPSNGRESFLRVGSDSFLAIAGTAIYDGGLGEEKKEEIYELFVDGGIERVRSQILGHYAIAIKREDEITLFTDPLGSFTLYYTRGEESWFASNSLYACAASCDRVSLDATRLIATILQSGLPADRTFYRGIRRLFGTQVLRSNAARGTLHVEECQPPTYSFPEQPSSVSDAVDKYAERVREVFGRIAEVEEIGIMLTGGLDSRTVLAAVLDQGRAPLIISGTGNNSTKTNEQDHRIAKKIARKFGLDFDEVDWSDNQPKSRGEIKKSFEKYGFKHEVYGSAKGMVNYMKMGKSKIILGGYSPIFTRKEPWKEKRSKFKMKDLVNKYITKREYAEDIAKSKKYKKEMEKDVKRSIDKRKSSFRSSNNTLKRYCIERIDMRVHRDARFANFANEFANYVDPFRTKMLYDPLRCISPNLRGGKKIQVGLIDRLEESLAKVNFYTGWHRKKLENKGLVKYKIDLTLKERISKFYLKKKVSNLLNRYAPGPVKRAVNEIRKAASTVWPQLHKEHAMKREYSRRLDDQEEVQQFVDDVSDFPLKALARLEYFAAGIESVADTIEGRSPSDTQK